MLCEGHRAGVEPAVKHLGHSLHGSAALRARIGHFVDIRTVQLHLRRLWVSCLLGELCTAADALLISAAALPDIQGSSPVTVTGDRPVLNILQPVSEASCSDGFRNPVYGIVVADQVVLNRCLPDIPRLSRIVDQRGVTSPAVRILMLKLRCVEQVAALFQIL